MKKEAAGGLAMLGAAILGGYYLLSRSQAQTIDLGSSGLGTGGNTSLTPPKHAIPIPGGESISSPGVSSPDSVTKGIEDSDTPSTRGITEVSDSGTYDTSAGDVASLFGEIAPWAGLGIFQSASKRVLTKGASAAEGSLLSRITGGLLGGALRTATRAIPIVGSVAFASDMLIGRAGDGGYTGEYDPSINTAIDELIAEQMGAAKTVSAVPADRSNYGMSDTPTLSKPYTGSTISALNAIAGTPVGTTWTNTYSATKSGASQSKGITTNTYKASSGQQVALAGISASDYAAYLANKK